MSSVAASVRQISANNGYYINVANPANKIYAYNPTAGTSTFAIAQWVSSGAVGGYAKVLSSISTAGTAIFKDMGRTIVSSTRTFRKVQLVYSTVSTFGVGGFQGTSPNEDYFTGYIELGFNGENPPGPFATFGR